MHDAVAVAALIKPEILTARDYYVQVETSVTSAGERLWQIIMVSASSHPTRMFWLTSTAKASLIFWIEAAARYGKESL